MKKGMIRLLNGTLLGGLLVGLLLIMAASAQYLTGPVEAIRLNGLSASGNSNNPKTVWIPVRGTNLDLQMLYYVSNGVSPNLTISVVKSFDTTNTVSALVFNVTAGAAGSLTEWSTQVNMGPYGWARVSNVFNGAATVYSNQFVIKATSKY